MEFTVCNHLSGLITSKICISELIVYFGLIFSVFGKLSLLNQQVSILLLIPSAISETRESPMMRVSDGLKFSMREET